MASSDDKSLRSLHLLFFTPYTLPDTTAAAVRCSYLIAALRANHTVDVISSTKDQGNFKLWITPHSNRSPLPVRLLLEILSGCELALRATGSRYQAVIFSSPPFFTVLIASAVCRWLRRPYVLDIRDLYPEVLFQSRLLSENGYWGRWLQRRAATMYRGAIAISTATEHLAAQIRHVVPKQVVHLVRNGFDRERFQPQPEKFPTFTCVMHGLLGRIHDVQLLLDAARIVAMEDPQIRFLIIGSGPKAHLLRGNLPSNLEYVPEIPYSEIPRMVGRCHLGLSLCMDIPQGIWAFPVRVYEYLGLGLWTLVAPPQCEAAKIVVELGLGEAVENSPVSLARRIVQLHRESPPTPARTTIDEFSRQVQAEEFRSMLEQAVAD